MSEEVKQEEVKEEVQQHPIHGGRNLMILGLSAVIIAVITTAISLVVYRSTGDIYLDRSRPGYISEGEKNDTKYESKETFSADGEINKKTIDEYLEQLDSVRGRIDSLSDTFTEDPLIDDALGIYPHEDD